MGAAFYAYGVNRYPEGTGVWSVRWKSDSNKPAKDLIDCGLDHTESPLQICSSLLAPAVMMMMMVVHVFHGDSAPHADHERLDLALVHTASDAEVTVLAPVLPPRVGSDLRREGLELLSSRK